MASPLSFTGKRWTLSDVSGREGIDATDIPSLLALIRAGRELTDDDTGSSWYDPAAYPESIKAAERVLRAVKDKETIGIFGDYDCDGVTSAAQLVRLLRRRNVEPVVRLPHRVHDGYGLKKGHVDGFTAEGVTVLITADTGISAHPAIDHARANGIDVIILDHHHVIDAPAAYATMHPTLAGIPLPHTSAAGVVFSFLHAVEGDDWNGRDIDLTLAMMGVVADLVPLRGNNRKLVQAGLQAAMRLPQSPLKLLIDDVSGGRPLTSTDIAFRVAPRINAAGRMADPQIALNALLEGGEALRDLETLNSVRQAETQSALDHALRDLTRDTNGELPPFISIASASYPPGILGLLAGKLTDKFGRPSMAVAIRGETCTASLRSPAHYNVTEALQRNAHLLETFGGHAQAGGATFTLENAMALMNALELDARDHIASESFDPVLVIDATLDATALSLDLCTHLQSLEPYGQGNPEPMFLIENAMLTNTRRVGADGKHLQATVGNCKAIGFGLGHLQSGVNQPVDIVCKIGVDNWNGKAVTQVFVQDVRVAVEQRVSW